MGLLYVYYYYNYTVYFWWKDDFILSTMLLKITLFSLQGVYIMCQYEYFTCPLEVSTLSTSVKIIYCIHKLCITIVFFNEYLPIVFFVFAVQQRQQNLPGILYPCSNLPDDFLPSSTHLALSCNFGTVIHLLEMNTI